jgi:DNA mismatch repair protein MutS2
MRRTIDPFSREVLEFPAVIDLLQGYLSGPISEPLLARVEPQTDPEKIRRDLELAREAREYLREGARPGLAALCEPSPLLEKLRVEGLALAALEIVALVEVARAGLDIYRTFGHGAAPRGARHEDAGSRAVATSRATEESDRGGRTQLGPMAPRTAEGGRTPFGPTATHPGGGSRAALGPASAHHGEGGRTPPGPAPTQATPPAAPSATPRLSELARALPDFRSLVTELAGKINPDGTVDSSASQELGRVRRAIERAKLEIQSSLERMLRRYSQDTVLQDAVVTIRNDRFVIPVRVEEKRRVQGVVHGTSSSGATVYIEPLETLALNNELVELQDRELAEVQRILGEFTGKLQERREDLGRAADILAEIDWSFAKGEFSRQFDCCIPEIGAERAICLNGVRHPLLQRALRTSDDRVVSLGLELKTPKTLMIISGPNAGGKTVALKALGIVALMAQAGIPVPAEEIKLPLFGRVLADIGDQQSIAANLSTFSAHVMNIEAMAEVVGQNDLVLLDEIGASTEPSEGAALAVAILEHFRQRGAMTVVTTHHSRLKAYGAETAEAVNAAMEFDEATLKPTFRLLVGLPGKSSALDIAARLGLESSIVEKARSLLHPADAETAALVAGLHHQRTEMESKLEELEVQKRDLEKRREQLEQQFQQDRRNKLRELDSRLEDTLRQYAKTWEQSLEELRRQAAPIKVVTRGERKASGLVREAREEWNTQVLEALGETAPTPQEPPPARPMAVGDRVQVMNVSTPGMLTALLEDGQVEVAVGRLKMRVGREEVRPLMPGGTTAAQATSATSRNEEVPEEFNVIGNTAEEARERVDKFLDQAFLAGRSRLRIIHGHGKGILRKTLHEMFASHPHVEKFYLAPPQEGGSGATIVELRT